MIEREVVFAPEARGDLLALYDWIAERADPLTAMGFIDRLEGFCRRFAHAGERGHRRDDIRPGLRIVGFERRATVAFFVGDLAVTILRIFHRGRNWEDESI